MARPFTGALRVAAASLGTLALALSCPLVPAAISNDIVISQIYGGGGNSGATYRNDFIELHNRSAAPVDVTGWSVQYASSSGTSWQRTPLAGTIPAGGYYLVQQAQGSGGTVSLPAPDALGTIAMSATAGKVALVRDNVTLTGSCPAGANIADLAGFGGANCFEGAGATPATSNTLAVFRDDQGCADTDDNLADFSSASPPVSPAPPAPRNSGSPLYACTDQPILSIDDVTVAEGDSGSVTASFTVRLSSPAAGEVTFDIATADGTATVADSDYVAGAVTASIPAGQLTYTFDVTVNGDTNAESNESFSVSVSAIAGAGAGNTSGTGTITNDDFTVPLHDVVISQVYGGGGNAGATYRNDFVELFNRGASAVSLAGWSVQYNSASGSGTWQAASLGGSIAPGGYFLVQLAAGAGGTADLPAPDATGGLALGASSGKIALSSSTLAFSGACPAGGALVDLVGYGSTACFEGPTGPASALSNTLAALRKRGGCVDANDNAGDFSSAAPAPRNSASAARSCDYQTLAIHAIQGSGPTTPVFGQDVITTGLVTARKANGFFVQTPDAAADADPATSQALFVFTSAAPAVAVGDEVSVKGTATEFFDLTQLESSLAGDVTVVSPGHPLPAPVALTPADLDPAGAAAQLERLEGMRVHADSVVSVAPTNDFGEVFTVLPGMPRPMREPGIEISRPVPPDPNTGIVDCCIPRWDENPERLLIDSDGLAGASRLFYTSGVTLANITGPLDYSFGDYKVLPEAAPLATANMTGVPVPVRAPNEFTVGSYNIENFNDSPTQRRKAALAVRTLMRAPDVVGVIEIASLAALESLAAQIDEDAVAAGDPDPGYEARLIPAPAGGTQHVGFLVRTSRVRIDAVTQERADELFTPGVLLHDRPPLVLRATVDPGGALEGQIIVVVNHLRSFIDIERLDAEGARVRAKRTAQAESIAGLLQELQTLNPSTPIISVGDYNAFQFNDGYTDPISVLKGSPTSGDRIVVGESPDLVTPDFVNLTDTLPAAEQYSFVFEGTPQALDHVIVNGVAQGLVQRYAIARGNADFPGSPFAGYSGDAGRPEASSDHDMPVAFLAFPGTPVVTLNGAATMTVEAYTAFVDPGATARDDRGTLPVTVTGQVDVNTPGTYQLAYTATNGFHTTTVTRTVNVADTTAPNITGFAVTPGSLGPPNHAMIDVIVLYGVSDASGTAACAVSVASSEAVNVPGDGNTAVDWEIVSAHHVRLRAERAGNGNGRVYTVTLTCADAAGNAATRTASVSVAR